jgi:hypothetical protein
MDPEGEYTLIRPTELPRTSEYTATHDADR